MKKSFGSSMIRAILFIFLAGLLTVGNVGCDSLEDANSSDGGTGSTPTITAQSLPELPGTGIVWKPVSEGDHKLVILIPKSYGNVGAAVLSAADQMIDQGRYVGRTNGNRPTYRFSRPGRDYPTPSHLRIGSTIYNVPNPANRYN